MPRRSITTAMVFAAGFGKRMRPLTDTTPKPLVVVNKRSMLDRALDQLAAAGITKAVVNTHYLADKVEAHLKARKGMPNITISREEPDILETGGGIVQALPYLGQEPFISVNGDVIVLDGKIPFIQRMLDAWNPATMDVLMLMHPLADAIGYEGQGDFNMAPSGEIISTANSPRDYIFTGIQIIHPKLFAGMKAEPFSLRVIWNRAKQTDGTLSRIHGIVHDGKWLHVGTMEGLAEAEALLKVWKK